MILIKKLLIILSAFILTLLDVSFFINMPIFGSTILISFITLIILAVTDKSETYYIFAIALTIFFSGLSSFPIILIIIDFLFLPIVLNRLRQNFFSFPTLISSFLYLIVTTIFFQLSILLYSRSFEITMLATIVKFVLLNSFFGLICFGIWQFVSRKRFNDSRSIKI